MSEPTPQEFKLTPLQAHAARLDDSIRRTMRAELEKRAASCDELAKEIRLRSDRMLALLVEELQVEVTPETLVELRDGPNEGEVWLVATPQATKPEATETAPPETTS